MWTGQGPQWNPWAEASAQLKTLSITQAPPRLKAQSINTASELWEAFHMLALSLLMGLQVAQIGSSVGCLSRGSGDVARLVVLHRGGAPQALLVGQQHQLATVGHHQAQLTVCLATCAHTACSRIAHSSARMLHKFHIEPFTAVKHPKTTPSALRADGAMGIFAAAIQQGMA